MNQRGLESKWGLRVDWMKWLPLMALGLTWLDLFRLLSFTWESREQYSHGWVVPFLCAYTFVVRWANRPLAQYGYSLLGLVGILGSGLMMLPLRVVFETNPDWPLVAWLYSLLVVFLTLFVIGVLGGTGWVKHLAFPVMFAMVSVVWPSTLERWMTQGLMNVVAAITVDLLGLFGYAAIQQGNLIEVGTGVVGVDEACSGIRSFQSSIMVGLILGELYRIKILPRVWLLIAAMVTAFLLNIARTFFLSWQASIHGPSIVSRYHDGAGLTILVLCFLVTWGVAVWFGARWRYGGPLAKDDRSFISLLHELTQTQRLLLAIAGVCSVLVLGGAESWYQIHGLKPIDFVKWSIQLPENTPGYEELKLTDSETKQLGYDTKKGGRWRDASGAQWSVWFFTWDSKSLASLVLARCHRPEVCLPASGRKLQQAHGVRRHNVHGIPIPFQGYTFDNHGSSIHVLFCTWQDGTEEFAHADNLGIAGRLWVARRGMRKLSQQTFEIIIAGVDNFAEAEAMAVERLPSLIKLNQRNN